VRARNPGPVSTKNRGNASPGAVLEGGHASGTTADRCARAKGRAPEPRAAAEGDARGTAPDGCARAKGRAPDPVAAAEGDAREGASTSARGRVPEGGACTGVSVAAARAARAASFAEVHAHPPTIGPCCAAYIIYNKNAG
jgi:hypothetical protein